MNRKKQIKFYTNLLKENEILLLKSCDSFFKNHYLGSPLNVLTNFSGSEGEAVINKQGKIKIFVDPRYHILVNKQVFQDIEIYKMNLGETFFEAFKKSYKKNTVMHVVSDISLGKYLKLNEHFDLRTYKLEPKFLKNLEFNKKNPIFLADKKVEQTDFLFKVEKLKALSKNIDKMLVFNLDCISYLTNLRSFQTNYSSNFRSFLYLDFKNSDYVLFSDKISKKIKIDGLNFKKLDEFVNFIQSQNDEIFIEHSDISLENFLAIKKPRENKKKNLALICSMKSKSVVDDMIDASQKLDFAILNFKKQLKEGLSEVELVEIFNSELLNSNLAGPSFKTILALGENSASIHYSTYDKNKILKPETLILLDCGGYSANGYATDITRTFYFGSNPDSMYKKIYTNVLKSFILCFLSKETDAKKVDFLAREFLKPFEKEGFYFNHGLGHGIGTSCHQNPPRLSNATSDIIQPYQTHSIEPGLYGKKNNLEFGVRIENCVYFDSVYNRHSLSKFPFEEILIDYEILNDVEKEFIKNWQGAFDEQI